MSAQSEHGALADEVRLVKFPSEMFLTCFIIVGRVVLIWIMCCVALRCVALRCVVLCCVVLCCVVLCCVVLCCLAKHMIMSSIHDDNIVMVMSCCVAMHDGNVVYR